MKRKRKPKPEPPKWFFYDNDNCWNCKNRNGCGCCKRLKNVKNRKKIAAKMCKEVID